MPFAVLEVQPTPNPNAVKFVLDAQIVTDRLSFIDAKSAQSHAIASRLFEINGVVSVLLLGDFVTVVKGPSAKWGNITTKVKKVLLNS